jgi:rare lipoprotein A
MARHAPTAAQRTLPFGSIVRVANLENGRAVMVTIIDRGPSGHHNQRRILDVSEPAALALGMTSAGVTRIRLEKCLSDQLAR